MCKYLAALYPSPELVWSAEEAGSFMDVLGHPLWWGKQGRAQPGACGKLSLHDMYLTMPIVSLDLKKGHCSHICLGTQF